MATLWSGLVILAQEVRLDVLDTADFVWSWVVLCWELTDAWLPFEFIG